jgi:threonine dehydrogenase-like Zn-dependent dehydrogenase
MKSRRKAQAVQRTGYSRMLGGFVGGQAEYLRVPYADVGPIKVPEAIALWRTTRHPNTVAVCGATAT